MNYSNPTPIQTGLHCTLVGHRYRVLGRVVLGMEDGGEIYYWHEFNLEGDNGKAATLVYEPDDEGGAWRCFTQFEPLAPFTAAHAAAMRVGQTTDLDGTPLRVTLVDETRVYHIEGMAPEGVELNDEARYFNAVGDNKMVVVSWTGDEVEYFWGTDLPLQAVATAFSLPVERFPRRAFAKTGGGGSWVPKVAVFGVIFIILAFVVANVIPSGARFRPVVKPKLSAPLLAVGGTGRIGNTTWNIRTVAPVEIAAVGQRYDCHQYELNDEQGMAAILLHNPQEAVRGWTFLRPFVPEKPMTALEAAARRVGDTVEIDGVKAVVRNLFLTSVQPSQGLEKAEPTARTVLYGFKAQAGSTNLFLVRWNEGGVTFYKGATVSGKEINGAFGVRK